VKLAGPPIHPGGAALVEEASIGVVDGAEEYMLGEVAEIAVGPRGSIYVFDRNVPALREYDAGGRYVRTIGRKGQGPGEYLSVAGLAVLADGRVLLWDIGNWRINVYSPAGQLLETWRTPSGASGTVTMGTSHALAVDSAGFVYSRRTLFGLRRPGERPPTAWVRMRGDGTVVDTIVPPALTGSPARVTATSPDGRFSTSDDLPFHPVPVAVLSPHGYFITGYPGRYAFEVPRAAAPASARAGLPSPPHWHAAFPVTSIRRNVPAEPVTSEERASARARLEEQLRRVDPRWSWGSTDIPRTKPFYDDIAVGADGTVWVALVEEPRYGAFSSSSGGSMGAGSRPGGPPPAPRPGPPPPPRPAVYDVFEPDGRYLGQVTIPAGVSIAVRRRDYAWGIARDADDVQSVKRYRLVWR
jgi:hypothetical protein